jgi:hypothetical protein
MGARIETAEHFGNVAAMPLTFLGYAALAKSLWPANVHLSGDTVSWPAVVAILLIAIGLLTVGAQYTQYRSANRSNITSAGNDAERTHAKSNKLDRLMPALERRYIRREHPAPGRLLPENWLDEEIRRINSESMTQELDELEADILKLSLLREPRIIGNPPELSEFQDTIQALWNRTGYEFTKALDAMRTLLSIWFSYRPSGPATTVRLPQGNVLLTPEIFASVQKQTKEAIKHWRLHVLAVESFLSHMTFAGNDERRK